MSKRAFFTLILLLTLLLSACQLQGARTSPTLIVKAGDYTFEAPEQVEGGLVTVSLENAGKEPHHVQLVKLNDEVTQEQFMAALQEGEEAILPLISFVGGVGLVDPGKRAQVQLNLQEGVHILLCFFPDANGVPHLAHGMVKPLRVTGNGGQDALQEPEADLTVRMNDYAFDLPAQVKAGQQTWKVTNDGPQLHELMILRLAEGKSIQDVAVYATNPSGPPPFEFIGGMQGLSVGASGWITTDLQPGNYVAVCFIPDQNDGKAHLEHGMAVPFSVQ